MLINFGLLLVNLLKLLFTFTTLGGINNVAARDYYPVHPKQLNETDETLTNEVVEVSAELTIQVRNSTEFNNDVDISTNETEKGNNLKSISF